MEDSAIIDLFNRRDEQAIAETAAKYAAYCGAVAGNILTLREDAEECLNDTWLAAWNDIPPSRPASLKSYLGRLTRNLAISRWRWAHAEKRYSGLELLLSELEDCVPAGTWPPRPASGKTASRSASSASGGNSGAAWNRKELHYESRRYLRRHHTDPG